jgi:hypothetical protein
MISDRIASGGGMQENRPTYWMWDFGLTSRRVSMLEEAALPECGTHIQENKDGKRSESADCGY